jgi:hypothetical protein
VIDHQFIQLLLHAVETIGKMNLTDPDLKLTKTLEIAVNVRQELHDREPCARRSQDYFQ